MVPSYCASSALPTSGFLQGRQIFFAIIIYRPNLNLANLCPSMLLFLLLLRSAQGQTAGQLLGRCAASRENAIHQFLQAALLSTCGSLSPSLGFRGGGHSWHVVPDDSRSLPSLVALCEGLVKGQWLLVIRPIVPTLGKSTP